LARRTQVFGFVLAFGVAGSILLLTSQAATPSASIEPESGTLAGAQQFSDSTASGGKAVKFGASTGGQYNQPVTHGSQLTINDVGPWALQGVPKGQEVLRTLNPGGERLSNHPNWGRPSWIPGTPYVYNNDPSNHGGIVPAGGMVIDGYNVPAGTWVTQFNNFTDGFIIEGDVNGTEGSWPGVLFRGNRMRGQTTAPGFINENATSNGGILWLTYNDAGGTSAKLPDITESIFESQSNARNVGRDAAHSDKMYVIRNYLSIASTLVFLRGDGDAAIENYGEGTVPYYNDTTYHLNGIANGGGETATLWLRNRLDFSPQPANSPYVYPQNDVIQMAADGGAYRGTGTNFDGSQGYQIRDNYLAGAVHTLQLGLDKNNGPGDVCKVVVTGNKFSTKYYQLSGQAQISYKNPVWNSCGNTWSSNTWADDYGSGSFPSTRQYANGTGPRSGQTIAAP
jgi:hypothetical protein